MHSSFYVNHAEITMSCLHRSHGGQNALPTLAACGRYRRGVGAPCSRGTMTCRRGYRQGRGGAEEHSGVLCQPLRSQCGGLRVRLQRATLVPGQKISQPVQNCGQRQAGGSVLTPITPACAAAEVAFDCNLCAGAGILRDDTNIVRAGALPQFLHKALGAGGIQPILPAVGAEVGLAGSCATMPMGS